MRKTLLLLGALAWPACTGSDSPGPNPGSGELGVGNFYYHCRAGDLVCLPGEIIGTFPGGFALGGRFGIDYTWKSESDHINDPLPSLQSAAPERLRRDDVTFTALVPGYAAVLAVTGNSQVVDLIHLRIREISGIRIADPSAPATSSFLEFHIAENDTEEIQAVPFDLDGTPLGGALEFTWASSDETILHIADGQGTGRARLEGLNVGEATLTLTLGEHSASIPVLVGPDPDPTSSSGSTGDSDDGTGTATSTTGTTGSDTGTTEATDTTDTDGTTGTAGETTGTTTGGVL